MTRRAVVLLAVVILGMAVFAVWPSARLAADVDGVPTVRPQRGSLDVLVRAVGEMSAERTIGISAPPIGGTMQIVQLATSGSFVKAGDIVLVLDPTEQKYNLEQARSELEEASQQILKLEADARVQAADDELALLKARFAVRRGEIAVSGNPFEGSIKARQNDLTLEEARQSLQQAQEAARRHSTTNQAALQMLTEKRQKAQLAMEFAQRNIDSMTVRAPIDGLVVVRENQDAAGGYYYTGMVLPEYRQGDSIQPGAVILHVVDVKSVALRVKIAESDRSLIVPGTPATVRFEGIAHPPVAATALGISGVAMPSMWEVTAEQQFDATFRIDARDLLVRPGMIAQVEIAGPRLTNVVHVPRQAVFEKDGTPVVYRRDRGGFTPVRVGVVRLTESRAVVTGLPESADVALVDPTRSAARGPKLAGMPMPAGGR